MIYTSLAVVVMSASSVVSPLSNLVHLHSRASQPDSRVSLTLRNQGNGFRDLRLDGHTYTVPQGGSLNVKAPTGTRIYADSTMPLHRRGDLLLEVSSTDNLKVINIR